MISKFLCCVLLLNCVISQDVEKPNIVVIMADDLGWDDVSFHGSDQIMTPNIDILAYQGTILQHYYSDTKGTSARSAFFTGKYPMRLGTQSDSILATEDRGIPISERLLPSYLRDLGYATHLIGKWHVGKSREHYLPTSRGFDTFYGFLDGSVDYYTYNLVEMGMKQDAECKFYQETEETAMHILCFCGPLMRKKKTYLGQQVVPPEEIQHFTAQRIWEFLDSTGLSSEL